MNAAAHTPKPSRCLLQASVGKDEDCPGPACAFWEDGGAVAEGGCAIERLGLPTSLELSRRPDLATWLLDVRREVERP